MSNDLTYGEADEVAERLMCANDVTVSDLTGALANALRRIASLEHRLYSGERIETKHATFHHEG